MPDDALHHLPSEINLDLAEVTVVLSVLDDAAEHASGPLLGRIDRARHTIIAKLWPELGDLLEDEDG